VILCNGAHNVNLYLMNFTKIAK